jgi:hypothetical protein
LALAIRWVVARAAPPFPPMRVLRALVTVLLGVGIAVAGAVVGGLIAVGLTAWVVPDDPFLIVVLGLALLLLFVPLGAMAAIWLASEIESER